MSPFFLYHDETLKSALARLGSADAVILQSIVCEELAQGPYTVIVSDEAQTLTLRVTGWAL